VHLLRTLVSDLLEFSRLGTAGKEWQWIDSGQVLSETLMDLKTLTEESHAVVTQSALPSVLADPTQLGQLFQNLIGNALKFRGKDPPRVQVSAERKSDEWEFSVRDNGIGIEPKHFERIFTIFQRLHERENFPGTGIGLAVCRKIVERHGGRIWIESAPGEGAAFKFTLPCDEKSAVNQYYRRQHDDQQTDGDSVRRG